MPAHAEPDPDSDEACFRIAAGSDAFAFLADPAEDIYTVQDGELFRAPA